MDLDELRADLDQLSRAVERMDRDAYMRIFQEFAEYEQQHPEAVNPEKIAIRAAEELALFMRDKRPLDPPLIEYRWRLHAFADAVIHPTMLHFLIYSICRALADGQGDLLQELDELMETILASHIEICCAPG